MTQINAQLLFFLLSERTAYSQFKPAAAAERRLLEVILLLLLRKIIIPPDTLNRPGDFYLYGSEANCALKTTFLQLNVISWRRRTHRILSEGDGGGKGKKKKKDGGSCRGKAQSQGCVRGAAVAAMDHSSSADG